MPPKIQTHKNTFTYTHTSYTSTKSIPIRNLCIKCTEIIKWKKKYGKYKQIKSPVKCCKCGLKSIVDSYHVICLNCSENEGKCCKCLNEYERKEDKSKDKEDEKKVLERMKEVKLSERVRRSLVRKIEKGEFDTVVDILDKIEEERKKEFEDDAFCFTEEEGEDLEEEGEDLEEDNDFSEED